MDHTHDVEDEALQDKVDPERLETGMRMATILANWYRRKVPAHVTFEDLYSAGLFGLAERVRSYDPNGGATFGTFIAWRIKGAILDWMRKEDWASRPHRELGQREMRVEHHLQQVHKREIDRWEIAEHLGMTLGRLSPRVQLSQSHPHVLGYLPPIYFPLVYLL